MSNKSATDLVNIAKQGIENLSPDQVSEEISNGVVTLIDLRESEELKQNGKIAGSVHIPRGTLEFCADPTFPKYNPVFVKDERLILYCATGSRSALATSTLHQMGYVNVAHLEGGFKAWTESGKKIVE
jgi:rhodanese-related sulfurtransferase